ncbi:helix-turn-helix transcriptional regulator [Streptacidiphilus sp. 4-A2]|nr:helix-turn-helix transcriptional regulator [Streptacidiphilus sp. 4-A2]
MLGALGLTDEGEAVYRLMIAQPDWTVAQLAGELGWGNDSVRAVLDQLADLELLRPSWTADGTPRMANPQVAFEVLLARRQADLTRQLQEVEVSRAVIASLMEEYSASDLGTDRDGIQRLHSMEDVRMMFQELGRQTREETLSFAPGGPQTPENRAASRPVTEALLARGVKVRTIYLSSVRNDPGSIAHADWLAEQGARTRTRPALPMRMQIVDRKVAVVPLDPDDSSKGAAVIREQGVLTGLCALFESVWEAAEPFGEASSTPKGEISNQQRELLRLLSKGLTDEAAARQLGVSLRTERRMITDLMEQLGAQSRFQLGQRVMEAGVL